MIDFDNVTMAIRSDLQTELKRLLQSEIIRGKVAVQRAYADWRRYPQYIVPLSESSIDLIFAPAHGANKKNATDIRLAIDALELVFTRPEIGTFILLSGDSDFSSLVLKLKEYGKYVIGVGIRESSSDLLIQNCDEYYSYNELAGFTKASEIEYVKRDPWELTVEAVKQMTAHNDVMRSDRLKQVMQEIDPNFDEKDAGFSRFSKFVVEAARRGLITLARLDNGQYEIALGPQVEGAPAQPSLAAASAEQAPRERESRGGRGGRGRGGRRGERERAPERSEEPEAEPAEPAAAAEPAPPTASGGGWLGALFGGEPKPSQAEPEPVPEEDDIPMPASSAPPPPYSQPAAAAGHHGASPGRSARFRRGSRGGPRIAPPEVPKIGVVEVDPNFRPRAEPAPAPAPPAFPSVSEPLGGEREERPARRGGRGGRGRGGRGGRGRSEREEGREGTAANGGGRGGRRGRGGRGRGREREPSAERPRFEEPPPPPPPPPSPAAADAASPDARDEGPGGESFWTRVKRGLTGGA